MIYHASMASTILTPTFFELCKGYILQGFTETLPISSSFHLNLFGVILHQKAHFATSIAGIIWLLCNGMLFDFIGRCVFLIKSLLYELFLYFFGNRKTIDNTSNIYLLFAICMTIGIAFLRFKFAPMMFRNTNGAIIGVIFASFMLIAEMNENTSENIDFKKFGKAHLGASIFMSCMALIPGASRLGAAYTSLRMLRLNRREAFLIATAEGAVGIFVIQILDIVSRKKNLFAIFKIVNRQELVPFLLCGVIYYIFLNIIMDKNHNLLF